MNSDTPETDAFAKEMYANGIDQHFDGLQAHSLARKLEKERDEALRLAKMNEQYARGTEIIIAERDHLKKVCDELMRHDKCCHGAGEHPHCGRCKAIALYNQLPHVKNK